MTDVKVPLKDLDNTEASGKVSERPRLAASSINPGPSLINQAGKMWIPTKAVQQKLWPQIQGRRRKLMQPRVRKRLCTEPSSDKDEEQTVWSFRESLLVLYGLQNFSTINAWMRALTL